MDRRTKAATHTGIYLVIVAAILVAGNVVSQRVSARFDLTDSDRFTLSAGSARLVRERLRQPMQIDVYVTRASPKYEAFVADVVDLMDAYERASEGRVHYSIIEPTTEEQRNAAKEAGLQEAAFGEGSETGRDQATISRGFFGIVFKYGSERVAIPVLSPDQSQGLEFWISNKIREVRDRGENEHQRFGVVTAKDELKLTEANLTPAPPGQAPGPTMKSILAQAFPSYQLEDTDLRGGQAPIDPQLVGLIVTQPGKDFSDAELRRIDEFLMLGGKAVAIFAGAVNVKPSDPTMKAELGTHRVDALLRGYGIEMKKEAILDWGRSITIPVPTESGQMMWFRAPAIVQVQRDERLDDAEQLLDSSFPGFFRLDELAFPFPSTLVAHPEEQPGARMKVVARSTPRSTVETSDTVDMRIAADREPKGEYGQRAMAIVLEGRIRSAFAGKDGAASDLASTSDSRLLVVSASQFLANPLARAGNPPAVPPTLTGLGGLGGDRDLQMMSQPYAQKYLTATILALKNTLDWMGGDADLVAASAKLLGAPNLTYSDIERPKTAPGEDEGVLARRMSDYRAERSRVQRRVQATLTVGPALLFVAFGLARWRLRDRARARYDLAKTKAPQGPAPQGE